MTVRFDFYESPNPDGNDGEKRYHPRAVTYKTISTDEIVRYIHTQSTLTEGDVKAALVSLGKALATHLSEGSRVHLEGIGYFQITLSSNKDVDPNKTRAQSVFFKAVKFRADKILNGLLKNIATERTPFKSHSARLTDEQVDKKLHAFFNDNKILTRKKFEKLCLFTRSTALKQLKRLLEEGKIENINTKRNPIYIKGEG